MTENIKGISWQEISKERFRIFRRSIKWRREHIATKIPGLSKEAKLYYLFSFLGWKQKEVARLINRNIRTVERKNRKYRHLWKKRGKR